MCDVGNTLTDRYNPPPFAKSVEDERPDHMLCNSYTMVRPHVCGDNPQTLASGLHVSPVQVDNFGITILYQALHIMRYCLQMLLRLV